ncbi:hypothetical protein PIB30_114143, partial [Stylosanthes scabra]|nr:hypothetical protein [Stylosanthes scabra]
CIVAESKFTRRQIADHGIQIGKIMHSNNGLGNAMKTLLAKKGKYTNTEGSRDGPVTRSAAAKVRTTGGRGRGGRSGFAFWKNRASWPNGIRQEKRI